MKRKLILGVVTLVLIVVFGARVAISAVHTRQLTQHLDLGVIHDQEKVEHSFELVNYTWRALEIIDVSISCGCTIVKDLPNSVPPLARLMVPVSVDLRSKSGHFTSPVVVKFNNAEVATLNLVGTVLHTYPSVVNFGSVLRGDKSKTYAVTLPDDLEEPVTIYSDEIMVATLDYDVDFETNVLESTVFSAY